MTNAFTCVLFSTFLLQSLECARKDMEGFVVGGTFTNIKEYPHSVYLQAYCESEWICGSSILNQRLLITAAHCIYGCEIRHGHRIEIYAGSGNLKSIQIKRLVKRLVVHQKYAEKEVLNDIGLAMLDRDIPLGRNAKRVIMQRDFPFNTVYARVAGWGTVDEDTRATSTTLKQVNQKLRSKVTCAKVGHLIQGMFCAGSENFYEDRPSEGDSGSALITRDFTAIGLVSFRIPIYPALMVYTNLTFYYDWIKENSRSIFCNG